MSEKIALMVDGGFLRKKLYQRNHRQATVQDITGFCSATLQKPALTTAHLLRIYFYDAKPFEGTVRHPLSGVTTNMAGTPQSLQNVNLLRSLELEPNFAVRRGIVSCQGWRLGSAALRSISRQPRLITAKDLVPDLKQKGVDMRIGLDIAWLATKRLVDAIVLVTGDSDFIAAMKLARKEGLRIYLETMGHPSMTLPALSSDTFRERTAGSSFWFFPVRIFSLSCITDQGSLRESRGGNLVPPTIYSVTRFRP